MKINDRFGYLIIIEQVAKNAWLCKCDCGKEIKLHSSSLLNKYGRKSCGCKRPRKLGISNQEQALNILWSRYRIKAEKRGLDYLLSKEKFKGLVFASCKYCGQIPNTPIKYRGKVLAVYNGVDRINSNIGYTNDNSVTCCWTCNRAKGNLTEDQFLTWVKRICINQYQDGEV